MKIKKSNIRVGKKRKLSFSLLAFILFLPSHSFFNLFYLTPSNKLAFFNILQLSTPFLHVYQSKSNRFLTFFFLLLLCLFIFCPSSEIILPLFPCLSSAGTITLPTILGSQLNYLKFYNFEFC